MNCYAWFEKAYCTLQKAADQQRLAHGLLIAAPYGSGKLDFAYYLAKSLLCEKHPDRLTSPCCECKSCLLIDAETHPDFYFIDTLVDSKGKKKQSIGVDQIRMLNDSLLETAQLGGWRIAVISSVTAMTTSSFNSLLKTLEEPKSRTMIILLTDSAAKVPATIKSRCQMVIPDLNNGLVKPWLKVQTSASDKVIDDALVYSDNSPIRAMKAIQDNELEEVRTFHESLDYLLKNKRTPQEVLDDTDLENEQVWNWLASYFYQINFGTASAGKPVEQYKHLDMKHTFKLYDKVLAYQKARFSGSNLQSKLQFQAILIQWFEIGRKIIHISNS
ncbi:DNA polymerase III subunit delta' [Aliikangiella sp. G2MR2-5]|uniref:DNA polymerase III subunit delta' n=1 Tax=Aliikangiella sp. G2MR2-5 TaxID=2788943 RepID=UPI0018AA2E07|nr:DNA polymerase III subunit delta' [Aliikangiella sp. G2MR2-5]